MSLAMQKALYRTAALVFEELSFLLPNPLEEPIGAAPAAGAEVSFHGPFEGCLLMRVSRDLVPILASNMLGSDTDPGEELTHDAVREIANVICGNVLPAIAGSEALFSLDAPSYFEGPIPEAVPDRGAIYADIHLGLDTGKADVMLYISGRAPA